MAMISLRIASHRHLAMADAVAHFDFRRKINGSHAVIRHDSGATLSGNDGTHRHFARPYTSISKR